MEYSELMEVTYIGDNENIESKVELSPISNTIIFSIQSKRYMYGYVLGDFNNWEVSDKYKLTWQLDTRDGNLKLFREIQFKDGLSNGIYKYKYILIDSQGDEKQSEYLSLFWKSIESKLQIYTSNNIITSSSPIELVGVCTGLYNEISFPNLIWYLHNEIKGVTINNNYLEVDNTVPDNTEIIVNARTEDFKLFNSKKIIVSKKDTNGILVHYYREDSNYKGNDYIWNCWGYSKNSNGQEIDFDIKTDFGVATYFSDENLIIRKKQWGYNWLNEWAEQSNTVEIRNDIKKENIYIIFGDNVTYYSLKEAITANNNKIKFAVMDDSKKIKVYLKNEPLLGINFDLYINGIKISNTTCIKKSKEVIIINLPNNIKANDLLTISPSNTYNPVKVLMRNYLDKFYYDKNDLGVIFREDNVSFKIWAPTAIKVNLLLFNKYDLTANNPSSVYKMIYDSKHGVFSLLLHKDLCEGMYYLYELYFNDIGNNKKIIENITYAVDPYAYFVGVNGDKGFVFDINDNKVKPQNWNDDISPYINEKEESILYEIHIRDFTIDENSGVKAELRGTYLGAVEENTRYKMGDIEVKTCLEHLIELGITHVHLLPVFDFDSVDERYPSSINRNWGYDPKNFNVPEGSYSTNPYNPIIRTIEFREMIRKFHKKGLRVIMDMVYNHMMSTINMENIVPGYYFRTDSLGKYTNGSGCGNEMRTEGSMVRKFILDSCIHWIKNYHIDGIRFDLMELIDLTTIKEIVKKSSNIDKNFIVYGEPWKGGYSLIKNGTYKGTQRNENFSIFNDVFRDIIRGDNNLSKGFINGNQHNGSINWGIIEGLKGSIYTLTYNPKESINYIDSHDNYTIWDQIIKSQNKLLKINEFMTSIINRPKDNIYVRQNLLAIGILMTAQGIPFIQGGSEILRTKQGEHNTYKSNDYINSIKWRNKYDYIEVFKYYKGLLDIRKTFPHFRLKNPDDIKNKISFAFANNDENSGVIMSYINLNDVGKGEIVVIYNGTAIDDYDINKCLYIPKGRNWTVIANNDQIRVEGLYEVNSSSIPKLKSFSIIILYRSNI